MSEVTKVGSVNLGAAQPAEHVTSTAQTVGAVTRVSFNTPQEAVQPVHHTMERTEAETTTRIGFDGSLSSSGTVRHVSGVEPEFMPTGASVMATIKTAAASSVSAPVAAHRSN